MDPISLLSFSWTLIGIIGQVLERIEQSKEHARALRRLHVEAQDFLQIVNDRLIQLSDATLYKTTITRLELLLKDILDTCNDYFERTWFSRVAQANAIKNRILYLDRRLQGFVDTYLIRAATETLLSLDALANMEPKPRTLLPDDVRWDLMSSQESRSVAPRSAAPSQSSRNKVENWRWTVPNTPPLSDRSRRHSQPTEYHPPSLAYEPSSPMSESRESGRSIHPPRQRLQPTEHHDPISEERENDQGTHPPEHTVLLSTRSSDHSAVTESSVTESSASAPHDIGYFDFSTARTSAPPSQTGNATVDDYMTYSEFIKIALDDPSVQLLYPLVFSVSETLEKMLKELNTLFWNSLLLDTTGIKHRILYLVTRLARDFWLSRNHRVLILDYFGPDANSRVPDITIPSNSLNSILEPTMHEDSNMLADLLPSLLHGNVKTKQIAETLAVLEGDLRRSDQMGECVRWLARGRCRDLMSFPERVENLVLYSIQVVEPKDIVKCCQMFYRVAEQSRAIKNFSAMRAIASALMSLERLRRETAFSAPDLERMVRLSCAVSIRTAKTAGSAYLCPLQDIFTSYPDDFLDIVDSDQRIRWSTFKELCHKLHDFVSQKDFPLVSPQPYSFHRSQLLECVKIILVNVKCYDARSQDNAAVRRYQAAYKTPQLFRPN